MTTSTTSPPTASGSGTAKTGPGSAPPAKNIYAGGAGLFATNPKTGHIYQYNGTPDQWTEIGGPGATFTVSDTHLYGLTPDRSATYRWDGAAGWTRIGGPENAAEREEDDRLLRENCQPAGRDCVKELRDAEKILETSLTDWLKENSLEFLLDTFDINDIRKCAADTDINSCLTVLLDAGSVILGVGAVKKAKNAFNRLRVYTNSWARPKRPATPTTSSKRSSISPRRSRIWPRTRGSTRTPDPNPGRDGTAAYSERDGSTTPPPTRPTETGPQEPRPAWTRRTSTKSEAQKQNK